MSRLASMKPGGSEGAIKGAREGVNEGGMERGSEGIGIEEHIWEQGRERNYICRWTNMADLSFYLMLSAVTS